VKTNLKEMIEYASANAELIFRRSGEFLPMWHATTADGEQLVLMSPDFLEDKDTGIAIVKRAFAEEDVVAYVFISEAWMLDASKDHYDEARLRAAMRAGLEHNPDRREVLAFAAENSDGELQTARRYILRPENSKPTLAPLMLDDMTHVTKSEGRMVGLLKKVVR
jgi:hypothetical protein